LHAIRFYLVGILAAVIEEKRNALHVFFLNVKRELKLIELCSTKLETTTAISVLLKGLFNNPVLS